MVAQGGCRNDPAHMEEVHDISCPNLRNLMVTRLSTLAVTTAPQMAGEMT